MNLGCLIHDLFDAILLCLKVVFSLGRYFLLSQHLIILKTLSKLSDRHLIQETVPGSFRRVKSLSADNRNTFKFSYLSDKFLLLFLFDLILFLPPLQRFTKFLVDFIPDLPLLFLQLLHLPHRVVLL